MSNNYIYALNNLVTNLNNLKEFIRKLYDNLIIKNEVSSVLDNLLKIDLSKLTLQSPNERWFILDIIYFQFNELLALNMFTNVNNLTEIKLIKLLLERYTQDLDFYLKNYILDALFAAINEDNSSQVFNFLSKDNKLLDQTNINGWGLFHCCASRGNNTLITKILDTCDKSNLNLRDEEGNTPILIAAAYGQVETIITLKEKGADITICNKADEGVQEILDKKGIELTNEQKKVIFEEEIQERQSSTLY